MADYPRTGIFTVEWVDASEPGEASNFGWFTAESVPPLEPRRTRALLGALLLALDEDLKDE